MSNDTPDDFDFNLLDRSVDDIVELAGFDVPPQGTYKFLVSAAAKKLPSGSHAVTLDYEVLDLVKLADPTERSPVVGTKFGELFMLDNEYGESNMKKALTPYVQHFQSSNLRELITEKIQNVQITATLKHRFNKKTDPNKETPYAQVSNVLID